MFLFNENFGPTLRLFLTYPVRVIKFGPKLRLFCCRLFEGEGGKAKNTKGCLPVSKASAKPKNGTPTHESSQSGGQSSGGGSCYGEACLRSKLNSTTEVRLTAQEDFHNPSFPIAAKVATITEEPFPPPRWESSCARFLLKLASELRKATWHSELTLFAELPFKVLVLGCPLSFGLSLGKVKLS